MPYVQFRFVSLCIARASSAPWTLVLRALACV
jgi:hypothetical protein